ncbi:MarR family transcriptional regulator [Candidatus Micrarchaeota archaeon]|nr:MarR family transcriptional regulator [Candidatus Micrarchaeota archaeon]
MIKPNSNLLVGAALIAAAAGLFLVTLDYNAAIHAVAMTFHTECPLPEGICPVESGVPSISIIAFALEGLVGLVGAWLLFSGITSQSRRAAAVRDASAKRSELSGDERKVYDLVAEANGAVFQSDLVERSGLNKVKVTRILDRLEGSGLVERRRRGMTNMVVLK